MIQVKGYAAQSATDKLTLLLFQSVHHSIQADKISESSLE